MAWTVPVIAVAAPAPALAASGAFSCGCLGYYGSAYNKAYGGALDYRGWYSVTWSITGRDTGATTSTGCAPAGVSGFTVSYGSTSQMTLSNGNTYTANLVTPGTTSGFTGNVTVAPRWEVPGSAGVGISTDWTQIVSTMTASYGGTTCTYAVTATSVNGGQPTFTMVSV